MLLNTLGFIIAMFRVVTWAPGIWYPLNTQRDLIALEFQINMLDSMYGKLSYKIVWGYRKFKVVFIQ